jgi:hypothetical protein
MGTAGSLLLREINIVVPPQQTKNGPHDYHGALNPFCIRNMNREGLLSAMVTTQWSRGGPQMDLTSGAVSHRIPCICLKGVVGLCRLELQTSTVSR